jgi:hypothetical protein
MPEHMPKPDDAAATAALFLQDRELRQRINPKLGWDRFQAAIRYAESLGFPKIHRLWGGRYWPAVKEWLDKHAGGGAAVAEEVEDGPENFGRDEYASTGQRTRSQARPRPQGRNDSVLLDGAPGRTQSDGLPRLVHPAAAGRR